MIYLLDTDHVSEMQSISEASRRLTARFGHIAPDDFGTSIITFEEQMRGRLAQIAASKQGMSSEKVVFYALLNTTLRFYSHIAVWQYTVSAAQEFEALQKTKIRIGTQDLRIASIAITSGATLLTRNTKDFSKVPHLLMDDWTV